MIWDKLPFFIGDAYGVDVRNLSAARDWYKKKLGLRESKNLRQEDSGRPVVDMCVSEHDEACVALVELEPGASRGKQQHVIFYARNLEKVQTWLAGRGVTAEPITTDSGGNHFFLFRDLDGNAIEVCVRPG